MRFVQALLPVCAIVAAGCFGTPTPGDDDAPRIGTEGPLYFETGVEKQERAADEYWLLLLTGAETLELKEGEGNDRAIPCRAPFLYELDRSKEMLIYDGSEDLSGTFPVLVVLDVTGVDFASSSYGTGCPIERALIPMYWSSGGNATIELDVPRYGTIELTLFPQGVVALPDGSVVTLGWGAGFNYTRTASTTANEYWVFGEWRAQNLGAWPLENLVPRD